MIPFLDLKAPYIELKHEIDDEVMRVLASGWYVGGEEVERFELEFANYCGASHAIGVANGLDALRLALLAMDIGAGDEVIVPTNTYIATWLAISQCGATPVPIEPDALSFTMNPILVEAAITSNTKVILPVHLYGAPANLDPLLEIAKRRGLMVLEDAAQAHGAIYKGRRVGGHGDAVAWSFYPGKNLGAMGDGGAITTNNPVIAEKLNKLRNYGSSEKYINPIKGFNSRLDPLQAAILSLKLKYLDAWNARRSKIASLYLSGLNEAGLMLPFAPEWGSSVWHLFVIRSKLRNKLQKALIANGVSTLIHYPIPPHLQEAYSEFGWKVGSFPISEKMANESLSLPIGPHLDEASTERIIAIVLSFTQKNNI